MSKEMISTRKFRLQYIRGLPMFDTPRFTKENFEAAIDYQPQDDDIIIASYPKTGTTWMQYIVLQILSKGEIFPSFQDVMLKFAPFLEMTGTEPVEALEKPRVYKHHLPYNMVKKNPKAKCIYIYRNPEDVLVSFYHHTRNVTFNYDVEFDQYFEYFVSAKVPYGSYFEHIKSYLSHKGDSNLLILTYEGLHANIKDEILKIAKFLGGDYFKAISNDNSLLDKIEKNTSFANMKNNLTYVLPYSLAKEPMPPQKIEFFRNGVTGEGKTCLSSDQQKRLREVAEKVLEGTIATSEWYRNKNLVNINSIS